MTSGVDPPVPAAGVPLSRPAAVKVTPVGSAPVRLNVAGEPSAVTEWEPAEPTVKVVVFALVIAGAVGCPATAKVPLPVAVPDSCRFSRRAGSRSTIRICA